MKVLWKHSYNGVGSTIEKEFLPDCISVNKMRLREGMCYYRDGAGSWAGVIRQESPPLRSPSAEHLKVTTGGTGCNQMLGAPQPGQVVASPFKRFDGFKGVGLI